MLKSEEEEEEEGGLTGLTGGWVLLTGLNLKEKGPSYDERSTEYVSANWLS